jgi:hypothetical protein
MRKSQSHEFEADVPAAELWEVYGTLLAAELLPKLLPQVLAKVELVSGDGGVGTILELTFPPGEILKPQFNPDVDGYILTEELFVAC